MFKERIKGHRTPNLHQSAKSDFATLADYLNSKRPSKNQAAIYFHVPFCDNICSFCSMNRSKLDGKLDDYANFLVEEIKKYSKFNYVQEMEFDSVYFGGGTPTTLKKTHLQKILRALFKNFNISKQAEISLESTLHNLDLNKLKLLQNEGANRLSIGIQTFSEDGRALLNRVHKKDQAIEKLHEIRSNFTGYLCTDIIYNYPKQTIQEATKDAKILKSLNIDSSSFYSLMFLEGSTLSKSIDTGYYDVGVDHDLHNAFVNEMFDGGEYEFLEYTKITKKGTDEYKYIKLTHSGSDILPIGVGAGGKIAEFSIFNLNKDQKIVTKVAKKDMYFKRFAALFQYDKISIKTINSFVTSETSQKLNDFFKKCEKNGYLSIKDDRLEFSIDGVFWGNTIANEIINIARKDFE